MSVRFQTCRLPAMGTYVPIAIADPIETLASPGTTHLAPTDSAPTFSGIPGRLRCPARTPMPADITRFLLPLEPLSATRLPFLANFFIDNDGGSLNSCRQDDSAIYNYMVAVIRGNLSSSTMDSHAVFRVALHPAVHGQSVRRLANRNGSCSAPPSLG